MNFCLQMHILLSSPPRGGLFYTNKKDFSYTLCRTCIYKHNTPIRIYTPTDTQFSSILAGLFKSVRIHMD